MPYNANIPQPTDQLSQSQPQLLANFQALQTLIDVNHVDFASADQGKHKKVTFPVQNPAPAFIAGEVGLYNFLSPLTTNNELYLTNSAGTSFPMTAKLGAGNGWSYLPSGLLIKWGINQAANGSTVVNFPVSANIPVFTAVYAAFVTTVDAGAGDSNTFVRLSSFNTTTITAYGSLRTIAGASAANFNYLVIGI
jgi:hypothetical protein